jgi:hypothetical protein
MTAAEAFVLKVSSIVLIWQHQIFPLGVSME